MASIYKIYNALHICQGNMVLNVSRGSFPLLPIKMKKFGAKRNSWLVKFISIYNTLVINKNNLA